MLERGFVGLPEASAIDDFVKRPANAAQRTLRLHIRVNYFETVGRMIDENFRTLPEGIPRRHAKPVSLRGVALAAEQTNKRTDAPDPTPTADRRRRSRCAAALRTQSRRPARQHRPPACRANPIPVHSTGNRPRTHRFRPIDAANSATLRSSDDSLQSVSHPARACTGRIATVRPRLPKRGAGHVDAPPDRHPPTVRRAGGWRSASR